MGIKYKLFKGGVKIISITVLIYGGFLPAQILVRGIIMTTDSVNRLSNASVKNLTAQSGTVSNDSGFYKIVANKGDQLEFSKTGFLTKKFVFAGETVLNITLSVSENLLDEIVVSASKGDQSLKTRLYRWRL